jgi:hypothetical protein
LCATEVHFEAQHVRNLLDALDCVQRFILLPDLDAVTMA